MPLSTNDFAGTRCIVAALISAKDKHAARQIAELQEKIVALGGTVVGTLVQRRGVSRASRPGGVQQLNAPMNAATLIGPGKADELAQLAAKTGADTVIFMNALKASQAARLSTLTRCRVMSADEE